jgi:hypothetical protein
MTTITKAAAPLKEKNMRRLAVVMVANFVAYIALVRGQALISDDWYTTLKGSSICCPPASASC